MKNKEKYNLSKLKFRVITDKRKDLKLPLKHWKIKVFDKDECIDIKYCEGGSITDLMAWLESEYKE